MSTRTDARGRRIPPPPAFSARPTDRAVAARPTVARMGEPDTRHAVGNITARRRRADRVETFGEWRALMAAPKGR